MDAIEEILEVLEGARPHRMSQEDWRDTMLDEIKRIAVRAIQDNERQLYLGPVGNC